MTAAWPTPSRPAMSLTVTSPGRSTPGWGDVVVVAERGDRTVVEGPAGAGGVAGGVEPFGEVVVAERRMAAGQIDSGGIGAAVLDDDHAPGDDYLVGGAAVPADADTGLGQVR